MKRSSKKEEVSIESLKEKSLKSLKRSRRSLRHDLIWTELGLSKHEDELANESKGVNESPKKRIKRWNEVLWTKPKNHQQTNWRPLSKRLARQPRNSLFNKLYIYRPTKKVYKNLSNELNLTKNKFRLKNQHVNLTKFGQFVENGQTYQNFNQPSNLLQFAINDAIASSRQLSNFESKSNDNMKGFENFLTAASSPSPNYTTPNSDDIFNSFNNYNQDNYQPKLYNLKTDNPISQIDQQIIKRNSVTNLYKLNNTPKFNSISSLVTDFPIASSANDSVFQRTSLLNPFNTPVFLKDKKITYANATAAKDQNLVKNARKLDLDLTDTKPLDDWNEEHDFTTRNFLKQVNLSNDC